MCRCCAQAFDLATGGLLPCLIPVDSNMFDRWYPDMIWHVWCPTMLQVVDCHVYALFTQTLLPDDILTCFGMFGISLLKHSWQVFYWHVLACFLFDSALDSPMTGGILSSGQDKMSSRESPENKYGVFQCFEMPWWGSLEVKYFFGEIFPFLKWSLFWGNMLQYIFLGGDLVGIYPWYLKASPRGATQLKKYAHAGFPEKTHAKVKVVCITENPGWGRSSCRISKWSYVNISIWEKCNLHVSSVLAANLCQHLTSVNSSALNHPWNLHVGLWDAFNYSTWKVDVKPSPRC